ncbi:MAG: hypothetical protein LRS46_02615 [Desulfurococcales archaeon]|nr:hypothetical protein [Desulfurococcales archaeon]
MSEEWYVEASKLLDRARNLNDKEKTVLKYFIDNVSVGTIRALRDLRRKGIDNPELIIDKLINLGLLEKGEYSYSLSKPLRMLRARRGSTQLNSIFI